MSQSSKKHHFGSDLCGLKLCEWSQQHLGLPEEAAKGAEGHWAPLGHWALTESSGPLEEMDLI